MDKRRECLGGEHGGCLVGSPPELFLESQAGRVTRLAGADSSAPLRSAQRGVARGRFWQGQTRPRGPNPDLGYTSSLTVFSPPELLRVLFKAVYGL